MVQHGQERGLDLHHGGFEDSPAWAKESYDCISMVQVISHLPSPIEALRLAYKMLNPNGIPSQMNVLYPGDDLFWALYRKPNSQP